MDLFAYWGWKWPHEQVQNVGMSYFLHGPIRGASENVIIAAVLHNCASLWADSAPRFIHGISRYPNPNIYIYPDISQSAMSSSRQVLLVGVHLCGMLSIYAARLFKKVWQPRYFLGSPRWMSLSPIGLGGFANFLFNKGKCKWFVHFHSFSWREQGTLLKLTYPLWLVFRQGPSHRTCDFAVDV